MRTKAQTRFLALFLGLASSGSWAEGGAAQEIGARVVDETSRSALAGAGVTLSTTDSTGVAQATTGPDGFFQLSAPAPGDDHPLDLVGARSYRETDRHQGGSASFGRGERCP